MNDLPYQVILINKITNTRKAGLLNVMKSADFKADQDGGSWLADLGNNEMNPKTEIDIKVRNTYTRVFDFHCFPSFFC